MIIKSQTEQLILFLRKSPDENLILELIEKFANLQNVSQLTACLPIPRAVGESIPWGILTMNLTIEEHENETTCCEQKPLIGWKEQLEKIRKQWKSPGNRADGEKFPNYTFTKISRFQAVG